MKTSLALLAAVFGLAPIAAAERITWRGGHGTEFTEKLNWQLPPGASEESERRAPTLGDVAVISTGGTVTISNLAASCDALELNSGTLEITGSAVFNTAGETSILNGTLILDGGSLTLADTTIGGGAELELRSGALLMPAQDIPASVPISFGPASAEVPVPTLTIPSSGDWYFRSPVTWKNCNVAAPLATFWFIDGDGALMMSSAPGGDYRWTAQKLQFAQDSVTSLVRFSGSTHRLDAAVDFGSPTVISGGPGEAETGPIVFEGLVRFFEAVILEAPTEWRSFSSLEIRAEGCELRASSTATNAKNVIKSVISLYESLTVGATKLEGFVQFTDPGAAGLFKLQVKPGDTLEVPSGSIFASLNKGFDYDHQRVEIPVTSTLKLGATSGGTPEEIEINCSLQNLGTIQFVENPDAPNFAVKAGGHWRNHGTIRVPIGHGTGTSSFERLHLVNFAQVRVTERIAASAPLTRATQLSDVFFQEPATPGIPLSILAIDAENAVVDVWRGDLRGDLSVADGSKLRVKEHDINGNPALPASVSFVDGNGQNVTRTVNTFFNFRSDALLIFGNDAGLIVDDFSAPAGQFPEAGLNSDAPIACDYLEIGPTVPSRLTLPPDSGGPALTVSSELIWQGGGFSKNGPGACTIEIAVGANVDAARFPGEPGGPFYLYENGQATGVTFNHRGGGGILNEEGLLGSVINRVNILPGAALTVLGLPAGGPRWRNEGTLASSGTFNCSGGLQNVGTLTVSGGRLTAGTGSNSTTDIAIANNAVYECKGGTYQNMNFTGAGWVEVTNTTNFSGTVEVNNLRFGNGTSTSNGPAVFTNSILRVLSQFEWVSGPFKAFAPGGVLEIGALCAGRIQNTETIAPGNSGTLRLIAPQSPPGTIRIYGDLDTMLDPVQTLASEGPVNFDVQPGGLLSIKGSGPFFNVAPGADFLGRVGVINNGGEIRTDKASTGNVAIHANWLQNSGATYIARDVEGDTFTFLKNFTQAGGLTDIVAANAAFSSAFAASAGDFAVHAQTAVLWSKAPALSGADVSFGDGMHEFAESIALSGGELSLGLFATLKRSTGTTASLDITGGARLRGEGTVQADVNVISGNIEPGYDSINATFSVDGDVTFGAQGRLTLKLPVNAAAPDANRLVVNGSVNFGGTLAIQQVNTPFLVDAGAFVPLVTYTSRTGEFATESGLSLAGPTDFLTDYRDASSTLGLIIGNDLPVDPNPDPNSADLSVEGAAPRPVAGRNFKLALKAKNAGPAAAENSTLKVTLPAGVAFVSSSPAGTLNGNEVTIQLGKIAKRAAKTATLTLTAPGIVGAALGFQADVATSTTDRDPANDTLAIGTIILPAAKLTFRDLINPGGDAAHTGFFEMNITPTGALTAKFVFGGKAFSIAGKLGADGAFTKTINVKGLGAVTLTLATLDADHLTGTLNVAGTDYALDAEAAENFTEDTPAPEAGAYTVLLDPGDANAGTPRGIGWAALSVTTRGKIKTTGVLGDGSKFSHGARLGDDGTFPLHLLLYKKTGFLSGVITFRDVPAQSDADATLDWFKPADTAARFAAGFDTTALLRAARYTKPATGAFILDGLAPSGDADLTLADGGLGTPLTKAATFNTQHLIAITPPNNEAIVAKAKARTGTLSGTFTPAGGRKTKFSGVFLQKANRAGGHFLAPADTGSVTIVPD